MFKLPRVDPGAASVQLRASELAMLLEGTPGGDLSSVKRLKRYQRMEGKNLS